MIESFVEEAKNASSRVEEMSKFKHVFEEELDDGIDPPELELFRKAFNERAKVYRRLKKIEGLDNQSLEVSSKVDGIRIRADRQKLVEEVIVMCYRIYQFWRRYMDNVDRMGEE